MIQMTYVGVIKIKKAPIYGLHIEAFLRSFIFDLVYSDHFCYHCYFFGFQCYCCYYL